jgi:hypothetical protein
MVCIYIGLPSITLINDVVGVIELSWKPACSKSNLYSSSVRSMPGWADYYVTNPPRTSWPPYSIPVRLSLYTVTLMESINVIVDINGLCAIQGNTSGWSDPINLCTAAGVSSSELFGDASAMIWHNDDMEHVFGIYGAGAEDNIGLVKELWSYFNTSTWAAHNVLHEVKSVVGSSPDSPLAPPASVESVLAAFDDGAKNVAYLDVNGAVYLCSHPLKGEWTTSYLSEIAQAPATASGSAPIISGP